MGHMQSISELFSEYEKLLEKRNGAGAGSRDAAQLMEKYRSLQSEIAAFCRSDGFLGVMQKLCTINAGKLRFSPTQCRIEFMGKVPPPMPFDHNNCFEVKENAKKMVLAVRSGKPDDEMAIKKLCVGYVTLVAIANSAKELFARARNAQSAQEAQNIGEIDNKIADLERELKERLGGLEDAEENGIYIGSRAISSNPRMLEHIKSTLGISGDIPEEKIVLSGEASSSSLFIDVSDKEKGTNEFRDFINGIFYKNFLKFNTDELVVACIEDKDLTSLPIQQMNKGLRDQGGPDEANLAAYSYAATVQNNKKEYSNGDVSITADELISMIENEMTSRKNILGTFDKYKSLEDYNNDNPYSKRPYILLMLSGYTKMSNPHDSKLKNLISIMKNGGRFGIFVLMMEEYEVLEKDDTNGNEGKNISPDWCALGIEKIEFGDRSFKKVSVTPNEVNSIRRNAKDKIKQSKVLYLDELLESKIKLSHYAREITIPVGLSNGKVYYFATSVDSTKGVYNAAPFSLIIGATGRGKSAFLHTLILSGAMCYSPDELQFYIVDFKSKDASAEFACYLHDESKENLYIPHVRYLSMKSTAENAYDVLDMINTEADKRARRFAEADVKDFVAYNSDERVKRGELPPIPQIYFLIDEYNAMLNGGVEKNTDESIQIQEKIESILKRVRTSGVGLIFSGQSCEFNKTTLANIGNRIAFDPGNERELTNLYDFEVDSENQGALYRSISGKIGTALSVRGSATANKDIVRTAFAGEHMKEREIAIARRIREKYSDPKYYVKQIVPGEDKMENGDGFLKDDYCSKPISYEIRDKKREDNELDLPLYLGVSSMTATPQPIRYYLQKELKSAFVFAKKTKQEHIERNAAVTLLHYMAVNGNAPNSPAIILNDIKVPVVDEFGNEMKGWDEDHNLVKMLNKYHLSHLCTVNQSAIAVARAIVEAELLREQRAEGNSGVKKPILLILHNMLSGNSLDNQINSELKKLKIEQERRQPEQNTGNAENQENENADDDSEDVDFEKLLGEDYADYSDVIDTIKDKTIDVSDVPDTKLLIDISGGQIPTVRETRDAFKSLFEKGISQNIFVLASFSSENVAAEWLGFNVFDSKSYDECCGAIFGSDAVRTSKKLENDKNTDCCFMMPQKVKTRLYDFSEKSSAFWKNLKNSLNN